MLRKSLTCVAAAAVTGVLAFAPAAPAQSGGVSGGGSATTAADPTFYNVPFGYRDLRRGMNGADVKTLNWALRGLALGTIPHHSFDWTTHGAVRSLQASSGLSASGVVNSYTRNAIAARMRSQQASWYGPGFWGNRTACGKKLRKRTIGVAHKKLPCGSRVVFAYGGRWVRAKVIDRGPYVKGRKWDLTRALAKKLGTIPVGTAVVKASVAR